MNITTSLNAEEYARFERKAKQLGVTEYALAKEAVLQVIDETKEETILRQIMRSFAKKFEAGEYIP